MPLTIEAIYENGVLEPTEPLPFKEHEKVTVTVRPIISLARQTAGMVLWTSDVETLVALGYQDGRTPGPPRVSAQRTDSALSRSGSNCRSDHCPRGSCAR
jgi:predicted DNA-binding antitoxin AbrB/MazE fold protein